MVDVLLVLVQMNMNKYVTGDECSYADIFIYTLAFCNTNEIDISKALINKMKKNIKKYPVDKFNGHF